MSLTYTLRQLKAELQMRTENDTLEWLDRLQKDHKFPRRLPGSTPPKWSKPAVDFWFENWDLPTEKIEGTPNVIVQLRKSLEEKYA